MRSLNNAFSSRILRRYKLTQDSSGQCTKHVVLSTKGSEFHYKVGQSIGVYPKNIKEVVERTLKALSGDPKVLLSLDPDQEKKPAWMLLENELDIHTVTHPLIDTLAKRQNIKEKREELELLLQNSSEMNAYCQRVQVWDCLEEHAEVSLSPQELCLLLNPLLPRLYSIASSPLVYPDEVHLTIKVVDYKTNEKQRYGVCSNFLCHEAEEEQTEIPIYLHEELALSLPKDPATPVIMIGPGTGVAPFIGFLQERVHLKSEGANWLFFGERTKVHDFCYGEELLAMKEKQQVRLSLAFSRDQDEKVYVQHRMWEERGELWKWINEEGANLYLCGDKDRMAKDVEQVLMKIVEDKTGCTRREARLYLKELRMDGRYQKDVY